jgi:hypothetical protein
VSKAVQKRYPNSMGALLIFVPIFALALLNYATSGWFAFLTGAGFIVYALSTMNKK